MGRVGTWWKYEQRPLGVPTSSNHCYNEFGNDACQWRMSQSSPDTSWWGEPSSYVHASTWWLRGGRTDTWERNVILIRKLNRICLRTSDNGITSNFSLQNKNHSQFKYTVVVGARPLALEVKRAKSILTYRHWLKSFPCRPPTPRLSSEMFDVVVARYGAPIDRSFWNPLCPP